MRELALARLSARTETAAGCCVILLLGAILSLSSPYFLTLPNFVNLIESLFGARPILAAGRLRRAGLRRDRHLVHRHGLGGAIPRRLRSPHRTGAAGARRIALGLGRRAWRSAA